MQITVRVQQQDFDLSAEYAALRQSSASVGAMVGFVGLVREFEQSKQAKRTKLEALNLQHYPNMTERVLEDIVDTASQRWPLLAATVIHRVGSLSPNEQIVLVLVASEHRQAAFASAEFIMDFLKTKAPFWKSIKQNNKQTWLTQKHSDQKASERW